MRYLFHFIIIIFSNPLFSQCDNELIEIIFETSTGEWAEEMSWSLIDSEGNELTSFQGYANDQEYISTFCLEPGCYALNAIDDWGDGWNGGSLLITSNENIEFGNKLESILIELEDGFDSYSFFQINTFNCEFTFLGCTDPNALNYNSNNMLDDGSCEYPECQENEYTLLIETQTGDWASEMMWSLHSYEDWNLGNEDTLMNFQGNNNGQLSSTQICLSPGCFMFTGYDSYGDGWEGGFVTISINDDILYSFDVQEQYTYFNFEIEVTACNWEIPGCTDESALNYNPLATIDDDTCITPLLFNWDNLSREYILHIPENLSANPALVFVFHGYTGSAEDIMSYSNMNTVADENGFVVCYPQGTEDQFGNTFFNVNYAFQNNPQVDDVGFIIALSEYLQETYQLSNVNTFSTGLSNGGDFSYLLACQASETFRAIAPVAGAIFEDIYTSCNMTSPVPVFETHGTEDDVTYYDGDPYNADGWGVYLDIPTTIDYFVEQNNLSELTFFEIPNTNPNDGSTIESYIYSSPYSNDEVWLYKVINGGHDWPGAWGNMDVNISEEIWKFFNQMSLPENISINEVNYKDKNFIKAIDILGREVKKSKMQIEIYDDGSINKKYIIN